MAVKSLQSVNNALTVLEHIAAHQPVGVSAIARETGLDKMAVQRILVTLHGRGWIRQVDRGRGGWELTALPMRVGEAYSASLRQNAKIHLQRLASESGETALLFRREGPRMVVIDGVDSSHLIRMTVPTGTEVAILRRGALDAFMDDEERATLAPGPAEPSTTRLAATRRDGYFVIDDMYPHAVAVGAPLVDAAGRVAGSVLVVGPRERLPRDSFRTIGGLVRSAAMSIVAV